MARRGRASPGAAAALLLAACSGGDAAHVKPDALAAGWPEGLYGNVRVSEFTGDMLGLEVRFFRKGKVRMAEFTACEGWCNAAYIAEVKRQGNGFAMSHRETFATFDAQQGESTASALVTYNFTPAGDALAVRVSRDGQALEMGEEPWLIRPIDRPFGLNVARSEQAGRAALRGHR